MSYTITKLPNNWQITDTSGNPVANGAFNVYSVNYSVTNDTFLIKGPGGPVFGCPLGQLIGPSGVTPQQKIESLYTDFLCS